MASTDKAPSYDAYGKNCQPSDKTLLKWNHRDINREVSAKPMPGKGSVNTAGYNADPKTGPAWGGPKGRTTSS